MNQTNSTICFYFFLKLVFLSSCLSCTSTCTHTHTLMMSQLLSWRAFSFLTHKRIISFVTHASTHLLFILCRTDVSTNTTHTISPSLIFVSRRIECMSARCAAQLSLGVFTHQNTTFCHHLTCIVSLLCPYLSFLHKFLLFLFLYHRALFNYSCSRSVFISSSPLLGFLKVLPGLNVFLAVVIFEILLSNTKSGGLFFWRQITLLIARVTTLLGMLRVRQS